MITTPTSFTLEYLSGLKFKDIQKLSVQFHVNKRWAKKQELIENLLALKKKNAAENCNEDDAKDWRDGSTIFNDLTFMGDNEVNRRLTFNITTRGNTDVKGLYTALEHQDDNKPLHEQINSRETYDIPPKNLDFSVEPLIESRATFDIPPKNLDFSVEPLIESRATFDIPPSANLIDGDKMRATVDIPLNEKKLFLKSDMNEISVKSKEVNSNVKNSKNSKIKIINAENPDQERKIKFDMNPKDGKFKENNPTNSEKKMAVPYKKINRRTKKDREGTKIEDSPIRMSNKSINIKKLTKLPIRKSELVKSPAFSSVQKSITKQSVIDSLKKSQSSRNLRSKMPIRLDFGEEVSKRYVVEKSKGILGRKLSKTADDILESKANSMKDNVRSVPSSVVRNLKVTPLGKTIVKDTKERILLGKLNSSVTQTPGNKEITALKPLTATKMPDFNKIHKKRFEQMDSLYDYIRKKEERIKKLFGVPQPGSQLQVYNKTTPMFRFQSEITDKENRNKNKENREKVTRLLRSKENISKNTQKETFKSRKMPSTFQTDIKDKNRSLIQGVRTNRRFELQMKIRNI